MRLTLLAGAALAGIVAMTPLARAQTPDSDSIKVCSGSPTKNYYFAMSEWLKRIPRDLFRKGENISTSGTMANLRNLDSGLCVAAPVQSDVVTQFMIENPGARDKLSIMKQLYTEYVHLLCPAAMKADTLSEFAKLSGSKKLIVDQDGSGTAETWRRLRQANDKLYGPIERDPQPTDVTSATSIMDRTDTCMLMVSGLNSNDMIAINQLSLKTPNGKPGLKLISIDDKVFTNLKGFDGKALYTVVEVQPRKPQGNQPGLYDNLINNGGVFSSASIDVLTVPAYLMVRNDWRDQIGRQKLQRITEVLLDALPTIWGRVNPGGRN